ncbi:hypothetical protein GCM10028796_36820 [Ramlibacter monticola]|uniref:Uncharacterized protein n=1 Tax=Ramlibacter monticola TaxID=1926872 RepID=A0A936Z430_9BURK|nr:hypothetical protein [Ramlibacter monticola]MBL0394569.1 hypothetical protein [Ramlibacter monticola]
MQFANGDFRVESSHPISGALWPAPGAAEYAVSSRSVAIALAAKCFVPQGNEIRVVHVPSGEIVFRKGEGAAPAPEQQARQSQPASH